LAPEGIAALCKQLKLDQVATDNGALAQRARDQQWAYSEFLEQVLSSKIALRTERTRDILTRVASFPAIKTLEEFDFGFAAGVNPAPGLN
jgi:DNA replication protein DnaC